MSLNFSISCTLFHFVLFSLGTAQEIGECPIQLTPLTQTDLNDYISSFDDDENAAGWLGQVGVVDVKSVPGGYKVSCSCAPNIGDSCYLEFDKDYSTNFQTWINGDGTYDLIQSSLIKCGNNGKNILLESGEAIAVYACYSYIHSYDSCDGSGTGIKTISISELRQFLSTIDSGNSNFLVDVGTAEIVPASDNSSLTVTCQCAGNGDACYLDIFSYDYSLGERRAQYSAARKGDGTFDLITSDPINCNNGNYVLATSDSNSDTRMYACYSTTAQKSDCGGDGVSSLTDDEIRQFLATYDYGYSYQYKLVDQGSVEIVPSVNGKSFTMVCQCNATGDMCYFEFSSNISTFLNKDFKENTASKRDDGNYDLITSGQIVCDGKGPYLRGESSWGYTIGSYACYSSLLIPNNGDDVSDYI